MGDSAKKKTIRFNSIRFTALSEHLPRQSTPGVLDSGPEAAGPVHRSYDRLARIATELLMPLRKRVATLPRIWAMTRSCSTVMHVAKLLKRCSCGTESKFFITILQRESIRIDFPITSLAYNLCQHGMARQYLYSYISCCQHAPAVGNDENGSWTKTAYCDKKSYTQCSARLVFFNFT